MRCLSSKKSPGRTGRHWRLALILLFFFPSLASSQPAQSPENLQLSPNRAVEKTISGNAAQSFGLSLESGQYVRLRLEQSQAECSLAIYNALRQKLQEVFYKGQATAHLSFLPKTSSDYTIVVTPVLMFSDTARYRLAIEDLRAVKAQDHLRLAAEKALSEGEYLQDKGAIRKAINRFEQALQLWRELGAFTEQGNALIKLGEIYQLSGNYQRSLTYFQQALRLSRERSDKQLEAEALNDCGYTDLYLGNKAKAYEAITQALTLSMATGNPRLRIQAFYRLGEYFDLSGDFANALVHYQEALTLAQQHNDLRAKALIIFNIGTVYSALNDKSPGLENLNEAVSLAQFLKDSRLEAWALISIGHLYSKLSEKQEALNYYSQAQRIIGSTGDRVWEASIYSGLGYVWDELGNKATALNYHKKALAIYQTTNLVKALIPALFTIGKLYQSINQQQQAMAYLLRAQRANQLARDREFEPVIIHQMGELFASMGNSRLAMQYFEKALKLNQLIHQPREEAVNLNGIGNLLFQNNEPFKAIEVFKQALKLSEQVGNKFEAINTLVFLAKIEMSLKNWQTARHHLNDAISLSEFIRQNVKGPELRTSYFSTAQKIYDLYVDLLMLLHRQNATAGFDALAFAMSERARARTLIELLLESQIDIREGVEASLLEREKELQQRFTEKAVFKDRLLSMQHSPAQLKALDAELEEISEALKRARSHIRAANPHYAALSASQSLTTSEIQALLDDDTALLEYRLGDERSFLWLVSSSTLQSFALPSREEIESEVARFYQLITESEGAVRGSIRLQNQPKARKVSDFTQSATRLSELLLAPVASHIAGKRLVIVADGALQYIPFAALPLNESAVGSRESEVNKPPTTNRQPESSISAVENLSRQADSRLPTPDARLPLICNHEIINLPSAAVLAVLRQEFGKRPTAEKSLAIFADPVFNQQDERLTASAGLKNSAASHRRMRTVRQRSIAELLTRTDKRAIDRLMFSSKEAEAILQLVNSNDALQATGFAASRDTVLQSELSRYRFIHFATHGLLDNHNPEMSSIVLSLYDESGKSQNGYLRFADICDLKLNAELVVLSACQTALGKEFRGEGLMGLTRGFMQAGAKRVVASLWNVNDKATAELMKRFYKKLLVDGLRPSAALRQAQIEMFQSKPWKSPYFWAGFTLQGEWR
ncbi:MAG: CHAT domain-containing protein [Acidobacteriota bacterium]